MLSLTTSKGDFFMANTFHVMGLPTTTHNEATREILNKQPDRSTFVREQVVKFAKYHGFEWSENGHKPSFINDDKWREYVTLSERSRHTDYTFLVAYQWLKSLDKFQYISNADLLRLIVLSNL